MKQKKQNNYFKHFKYFYEYLRYRILVGIVISITVGLLDGFGLAMFLPLLTLIDKKGVATPDGMGNLSFVADGLSYLGLDLTFGVILIFLFVLFVVKGVMKYVESYYNTVVTTYFILTIRNQCVQSFSDFSYKAFVRADSGKIQNTLSGEVGRIAAAYNAFRSVIQNGVFVLVYVVLAFLSNPQFSVLILVGGILTNFIFQGINKKAKEISSSITMYGHVYQGLLIQMVAFFKYLKATGRLNSYSLKLIKSIKDIERSNREMGIISSFLGAVREPLVMLVILSVIYIQVAVFEQSLGLLLLSLMFFYRALNFLMIVQTSWSGFLGVSGALDNMEHFIDDLKDNKEECGEIKLKAFEKNIVLENLNFAYNDKDLILKNVSLEIQKNQTIAFVGESGSGKTTLVNIISGLISVNNNELKIDGINSNNLDMRTFQNRIGYITQEPVIFDVDIFDNVTFWDERTPDNIERFWTAIKKASIYDFVQSLNHKENSLLGNNGIMVSGGQKQRISIARELYKDIDILIMDEATSALDSETEKVIQDNIDSLKGKYTIIIVAHRLSTIRNADKIVLMSKGEIQMEGNFESLYNKNLAFQRMVSLQELN